MRSKPIFFAGTLLIILSAALWGVNYRLNHLPLTAADKQFRSRVAGADSVVIRARKPVGFVARGAPRQVLNAEQTQNLIESLRFTRAETQRGVMALSPLELTFVRAGQNLARFELYRAEGKSELETLEKPYQVYRLHPRFEKPLSRALGETSTQEKSP